MQSMATMVVLVVNVQLGYAPSLDKGGQLQIYLLHGVEKAWPFLDVKVIRPFLVLQAHN
jgi:hypothetical protein